MTVKANNANMKFLAWLILETKLTIKIKFPKNINEMIV